MHQAETPKEKSAHYRTVDRQQRMVAPIAILTGAAYMGAGNKKILWYIAAIFITVWHLCAVVTDMIMQATNTVTYTTVLTKQINLIMLSQQSKTN